MGSVCNRGTDLLKCVVLPSNISKSRYQKSRDRQKEGEKMLIRNIKSRSVHQVAEGTKFPEFAFEIVTQEQLDAEKNELIHKSAEKRPQETPAKPAVKKKTTKSSSSKKKPASAKKTTEKKKSVIIK